MREWESRSLGDLVTIQKGRKVPVSAYPRAGYAPYLGAGVLAGGEASEFADTAGAVLAGNSDVLMLWDGERSGLVATGKAGVVSSTAARLSSKSGIDPALLAHVLRDRFDWIQARRTGTGVPHVPKDIARILILRYPADRREQQRIAEILATVDEAIEQTEALIAKTQAIKAGLMHDLFTRGVLPNDELRPPREQAPELYKPSPLGWIPRAWSIERLDSVATVDRGKFAIRPRNDPRYYEGPYPFLQTGDVAEAGGKVVYEYRQSLNGLGLTVSRCFPAGTVMVTIAANIGDTCILGIPMCAPDSLVGVVPRRADDSAFIEMAVRRRKRFLESRAPQTAQKNINLDDLRPLAIAWPSIDERCLLVARKQAIDIELEKCQAQKNNLMDLRAGLMRDLLTGCVRVPSRDMHANAAPAEPATA